MTTMFSLPRRPCKTTRPNTTLETYERGLFLDGHAPRVPTKRVLLMTRIHFSLDPQPPRTLQDAYSNTLQEYLAHKTPPPPRTLLWACLGS